MTWRDQLEAAPAFHRSVVQLACTQCGAEANASCSCGKPYVPVQQRANEYAKANPDASVREIEEKAGVGHGTAQRAKAGVPHGTADTVTGRDGKTYKATKPQRPSYEPEPGEDDLIDFVVDHFRRLSRTAQVRCAIKLRRIIRGEI